MMSNNTTYSNVTSQTYPDWSTQITAVSSIDFTLVAIATLLHLVGMTIQIVTFKSKLVIPNQNLLLINLSLVSLFSIGTNACAVYYMMHKISFSKDFIATFYVAYMGYILNLITLTTDRVLFVMLNLRYKSMIQSSVIYTTIVLVWVISIIYGLVLRFATFNRSLYFKYAHHVFNGFTCVFAATCYVIIIIKVIASSHGLRKNRSSSLRMLKKFVVPFTLVFSFFLFQYLPSILTTHVVFKDKEKNRLFVIGLIGVNILNSISDPLSYIFLQPKIKQKMKQIYKKKFKSQKTHTTQNTNINCDK